MSDDARGEQRRPAQNSAAAGAGWLEANIGRAADFVTGLRGWHQLLAALLAGGISILAMAPFHLWPILLFTLPVLVWLIEGARTQAWWRAGLVGWCFALAYHVPGLYWLREAFAVTAGKIELLWPLAVLGLPAYLALYTGAAASVVALTCIQGRTASRRPRCTVCRKRHGAPFASMAKRPQSRRRASPRESERSSSAEWLTCWSRPSVREFSRSVARPLNPPCRGAKRTSWWSRVTTAWLTRQASCLARSALAMPWPGALQLR